MPARDATVDAWIDRDAVPYARVAARLLCFLLPCYFVAMVDRLNVGYAKLQFMADLHFDEAVFGTAAGSLYVGYILFEVPSNLMLQRIGLRRTLLRIMSLWGVFTMCMALASDRGSFYAVRFLIGAAEAGFFPGILYYFTLWFPDRYRARVISLFALAVPLSGVVAAPVSVFLMSQLAGVAGLRGWQWLFLLEGAPAIALGLAALRWIPDHPRQARFLSEGEQRALLQDLARDRPAKPGASSFGEALRQARTYVLALVYFAFFATQSILLLWVPTLLRNAGVETLAQIGWRSAVVFLAGAIGMAAIGWSSDRRGERRAHLVLAGLGACVALALLPLARHSAPGTIACLMAAAACLFGYLALFWTVPTAILGEGARAGGVALVSSIGASGSALSPMFLGQMQVWTGSLFGAIDVLAVLFLCSLGLVWMCAPPAAGPGRGGARLGA